MSKRKPLDQLSRSQVFKRLNQSTVEIQRNEDSSSDSNLAASDSNLSGFEDNSHVESIENIHSEQSLSIDEEEQVARQVNTPIEEEEENSIGSEISFSDADSESVSDDDDFPLVEQSSSDSEDAYSLKEELAKIVVKHSLGTTVTRDILVALKRGGINDLPISRKTLVGTPVERVQFRIVPPGRYFHFGVKNGLLKSLKETSSNLRNIVTLKIICNIDGVSLSKSSTSQFTSILGKVFNLKHTHVFKCGIYHGMKKPDSADIFLQEFVEECVILCTDGIEHEGKQYEVRMWCFTCDLPAKSFILCTKGHNASCGCSKCVIAGVQINRRMTFIGKDFAERTDASFRSRQQPEYHSGESPLEAIPYVNMIDMFPMDCMHQVYVGVCKKFLNLLFGKKVTQNKLPLHLRQAATNAARNLKPRIPLEFQRTPREMDCVNSFKATECRLFVLYTGPIIMKTILNQSRTNLDIYQHFLCLHVAITMLSKTASEVEIDYCEKILKNYSSDFGKIFGEEFVSINVHCVTHIPADVRKFGPIETYSAFIFENENRIIKKALKESPNPLQQIVKRHLEYEINFPPERQEDYQGLSFSKFHENGPLLEGTRAPQYRCVHFESFMIKNDVANSCIMMKDTYDVCIVENIATEVGTGEKVLIGRTFSQKSDLYKFPRRSSSLHIYLVKELGELSIIRIRNVRSKCLLFPQSNDEYAVFPMLHTTQ